MSDVTKPFHNPFAVLSHLRGEPPAVADKAAKPTTPVAESAAVSAKPVSRAVVRMERSGRGGKEVTVIEHLGLRQPELEVWLKALKSALGCGGVVEDECIVVQGDQRKRLPALLTARGVKKITVA